MEAQREPNLASFETRAGPVSRHVENGRPTQSEVSPQDGSLQTSGDRAVNPHRDLRVHRYARKASVNAERCVRIEEQWCERGRLIDQSMTERRGEPVTRSIAAGFRQRSAAGRENNDARSDRVAGGLQHETGPVRFARDTGHAATQ